MFPGIRKHPFNVFKEQEGLGLFYFKSKRIGACMSIIVYALYYYRIPAL